MRFIILFLAIIISAVSGFVLGKRVETNATDVIYLGIFGGVAALPTSFSIDVSTMTGQGLLVGDDARVLVGSSESAGQEFMSFIAKSVSSEVERCGINYTAGSHESTRFAMIEYSGDFAYFYGDYEEYLDLFMNLVCATVPVERAGR